MTLSHQETTNLGCFRWHEAVSVFVLSRTLVVIIIAVLSLVHFNTEPAHGGLLVHGRTNFNLNELFERLTQVLQSADAGWYLEIARSGYHDGPFTSDEPKNWVFFPLVPLLIRGLSFLCGSVFAAGITLNIAMTLAALLLLQRYAKAIGFEEPQQSRALWFLGFFPFSYFFIAPMSEPTFLVVSIAAFLMLAKDRPILSAFLMALATACRPTGALLLPAYAFVLFRQNKLFTAKGITACLISPLGLLLYLGFLYLQTDNPLACIQNQITWGRGGQGFTEMLGSFSLVEPWNLEVVNAAFLLVGLAASIYLARKQHYGLSLALVVPLLFCVSTGTLISVGRMCAGLFPIYLALALWANTQFRERCVLVIFSGLLFALSVGYALQFSAAMT